MPARLFFLGMTIAISVVLASITRCFLLRDSSEPIVLYLQRCPTCFVCELDTLPNERYRDVVIY